MLLNSQPLRFFVCPDRRRCELPRLAFFGILFLLRRVAVRNIKLISMTILLLVALVETSSRADILFSVTPMRLPLLAPEQDLQGFCACQIDANTTDGGLISALDINITGRFHQRWYDIGFDGIPDPSPIGASADGRGDSHLTPVSGALIGSVPVENNNVFPSPLPNPNSDWNYGVGTSLRGAWGIPRVSLSSTASVAYLVLPRYVTDEYDEIFDFDLNYAIATSSGTFRGTFGPFLTGSAAVFCLPEPSTLTGAGLAVLALTCWRRSV